MDILQERALLAESRAKSRVESIEVDNPVITKPAPFLTIRDIVARYSRGELVTVPEKQYEHPVYDDAVEHITPYTSDLDMQQRVVDFKDEYEKAKESRSSADQSVNVPSGAEILSDGAAQGDDPSAGK